MQIPLTEFVLVFFCLLALCSAASIPFLKNIVHVAFAFLATLSAIAALYFILDAEVAGATQLMVYVGGILVLLLFGVMLTQNYTQELDPIALKNYILPVVLVLGVMGGLGTAAWQMTKQDLPWQVMIADKPVLSQTLPQTMPISNSILNNTLNNHPHNQNNAQTPVFPKPLTHIQSIAEIFLTQHLIAFELVGILLTVALLGAALISRPKVEIQDHKVEI